ncbi:MAG: hypothetical protein U1G07_08735 [Verrucomicrobiota bacterium]
MQTQRPLRAKITLRIGAAILLSAVFHHLPSVNRAFAQGCVAARGSGMPVSMLGHLGPQFGEPLPPTSGFQAAVGYRWLHSDRHFVGDEEQKQRQREGSEVINDSHFIDLGITYAFNTRFSATLTLPLVVHDRSQVVRSNDVARSILQRFHTQSAGIGDVRVEGNMWVLKPEDHAKGNILLGLGIDAPTGEDDAKDTFQVFDAPSKQVVARERTVDQSIQPGDGGWGVTFDIYAYRQLVPRLNAFINGAYTFTPEEKNGVPTFRSNPFEAEMSIPDTYMGRGGLEFVLWPKYNLSLSLAGRIEGVPVEDAIGGSDGFRRPGYAIAIEPGIAASIKSWSVALNTPVALYRNREKSVPDQQQSEATGTPQHGDAAFADFLVMFTVAKRF